MNRFDVFENPELQRQPNTPCVTAAVNPGFEVPGEKLSLEPFQVAFIPTALLSRRVGTLALERTANIRAMDCLMSGL